MEELSCLQSNIERKCFNLQGFPEDYKLPDVCDSALYKLAGNAVSVPVVNLIVNKLCYELKKPKIFEGVIARASCSTGFPRYILFFWSQIADLEAFLYCTVLCIGSLILIGFFLIILLSNACESRHSVLPLLKTILGFLLTLSSFVYVYFVGFIHNSISTVVVEKYSVKVFQNKVPFFH